MGLRKVGCEDGKWMNYLRIVSIDELRSPWCWTSGVWYHRVSRLVTCKVGVKFFPAFSRNRNFDSHWCILGEDINVVMNNLEIICNRCRSISLEIRPEKTNSGQGYRYNAATANRWFEQKSGISYFGTAIIKQTRARYITHMMLRQKPTWFVLNGINEVNNKCVQNYNRIPS
jgi:hypothetical protein